MLSLDETLQHIRLAVAGSEYWVFPLSTVPAVKIAVNILNKHYGTEELRSTVGIFDMQQYKLPVPLHMVIIAEKTHMSAAQLTEALREYAGPPDPDVPLPDLDADVQSIVVIGYDEELAATALMDLLQLNNERN